jgi:hypothetical protein
MFRTEARAITAKYRLKIRPLVLQPHLPWWWGRFPPAGREGRQKVDQAANSVLICSQIRLTVERLTAA